MTTIYRGNIMAGAIFSPCMQYRYQLWRVWDFDRPYAVWIGLNPSKADDQKNDNTIRRVLDFTKRWNYGGAVMLNLFAFRATHPEVMMSASDPVGPENDSQIDTVCRAAKIMVACWGNLGVHLGRGVAVAKRLNSIGNLKCLKLTEQGQPWHPLYVRKTTVPFVYPVFEDGK